MHCRNDFPILFTNISLSSIPEICLRFDGKMALVHLHTKYGLVNGLFSAEELRESGEKASTYPKICTGLFYSNIINNFQLTSMAACKSDLSIISKV